MSGLAVLFHRDGRPADHEAISMMLAAAPYRGPDGVAIWRRGPIALGHAKMAVTVEDDHEQQPLVSPRTGCVIVADLRLDNRDELLAGLPERPQSPIGDADIVLCAYERWGLDAFARLLGDFALAIWDPRCRRLTCARDTSGQRRLFYRTGATFAAASEIHQLLQDPVVPIRPNEERILERLTPLNMFRNEKDPTETYYEGIYAVPAGHFLTVDRDTLRASRYWELMPGKEIRYRDQAQYGEQFRHLLSDAVRARLRSARPIGALLSGGLDSSSIVGVAQQLYQTGLVENRGFSSFSVVFGGLECDEQALIADTQRMYGFPAHYLPLDFATGRLQLDAAGFQESPNVGSQEMRDRLCAAAAQAGVRVLLSGEMADSCVTGSRLVFDSLLRQGHLGEFRRHFRAHRRATHESLAATALFACLGPLLPLPIQKSLNRAKIRRDYRQSGRYWLPAWISEPLRSELTARNLASCLAIERQRRFANPTRHVEHDMLYPPEMARHPTPWPVEFSRPYASRRLHEFLLAIPPEQKFAPHPHTDEFYAGSKRLVRRSMRGIIPESVRQQWSKNVFDAQFQREIERQWPLYEATFGPSACSEVARRGYIDKGHFWSRLTRWRDGEPGPDIPYVLQMVGLETWLQALRQPRPQLVTVATVPTSGLKVGREVTFVAARRRTESGAERRSEWRDDQ